MPITYRPRGDQESAVWLTNFAQKLPGYAGPLGLAAEVIAATKADALYYDWTVKVTLLFRDHAQAWTSFRNELAEGKAVGNPPKLPELPTPPPAVAPGVLSRNTKLVNAIKNAAGYTEAIGKDLGIVSPESAGLNTDALKPILKVSRAPLGVLIKWTKQGQRKLYLWLQVDRGDGHGWQFLALDTEPDYLDTFAITAPTTWKYRAQYRLGDELVGEWSDVVTVVVG